MSLSSQTMKAVGPGFAPVPAEGRAERQPTVLVIGQAPEDRAAVVQVFENEGFVCRESTSLGAAERLGNLQDPDLIVLDGRMGDGGATAICHRLAMIQSAPIIILSEDADVTDRVIALEAGADDLIARPFSKRELLARARALLRRSSRKSTGPAATFAGPADADFRTHTRMLVGPAGSVSLSPVLALTLRVLLSPPGRLVTPRDVEGPDPGGQKPTYFRTTAIRLRKKFAEAGLDPNIIRSVRGSEGYSLDTDVTIRLVDEAAGR